MGFEEEGVEQLDVRTKWGHEALDFTRWLAGNLDLLGAELDMKLELVQREKPVGPLSLDILATETDTDTMVAIENQLEWTDNGHLGQLITYAAGCDAHVAIWVAPEFRYEYAQALRRLNEWTRDGIRFYGVKVEVIRRSGNSCPEARFRKVVFPGGWNKDITQEPGATMSPRAQQHYDFFQPLIATLISSDFADKAIQYFDHTGRIFASRINPAIGYAASFYGDSAWVTLNIRMEDNELTKHVFDTLQVDRERIERSVDAGLDPDWRWLRADRYYFSTINVRRVGSIDDPPEKLEETRAWMMDLLPKFKEVFDRRLDDILKGAPFQA